MSLCKALLCMALFEIGCRVKQTWRSNVSVCAAFVGCDWVLCCQIVFIVRTNIDPRRLRALAVRDRVGCMLAGFLLNRQPFFRGKDNEDQLVRIALVLGTQGLHNFLRKYGKKPRHALLLSTQALRPSFPPDSIQFFCLPLLLLGRFPSTPTD